MKCCSSSTTELSHSLQSLSFKCTCGLEYQPVSIANGNAPEEFATELVNDRNQPNGNKLRTYRLYKENVNAEQFVLSNIPRPVRRTMHKNVMKIFYVLKCFYGVCEQEVAGFHYISI
jgi:hypothetical protein